MQLPGSIWMLQIFPAVICGLYTRWLRASALLLGWIAGRRWAARWPGMRD
ncbi:MAG TPA: hypothetical protein VFW60_04080 [Rhodanobacteraceae bacterium]|nr:hypothetical protein [Rhodanobacteraceae bacterium]